MFVKPTQYFLDVPSKFLSSPHLEHKTKKMVVVRVWKVKQQENKMPFETDIRSAVSELHSYF